MNKTQKTRIGLTAILALFLASFLSYLIFHYELSWEEIKTYVQDAPAWIFLCTLILLPPLGLPLSIFLFAVGAKFGLAFGASVACFAIVAHHAISLGLSSTVARFVSTTEKQAGLWQKLEEKAGGNSSKLLFLWGLLPGLPYVVKLYLPLAMGVKAAPYMRWNSSGHALGAILFVGFGNAVFDGLSVSVLVVIGLGIALSVAFKIYRYRLRKMDQSVPATDAT